MPSSRSGRLSSRESDGGHDGFAGMAWDHPRWFDPVAKGVAQCTAGHPTTRSSGPALASATSVPHHRHHQRDPVDRTRGPAAPRRSRRLGTGPGHAVFALHAGSGRGGDAPAAQPADRRLARGGSGRRHHRADGLRFAREPLRPSLRAAGLRHHVPLGPLQGGGHRSEDSTLPVPSGPGLGVEIDRDFVARYRTDGR